jgi:hypothetical protein
MGAKLAWRATPGLGFNPGVACMNDLRATRWAGGRRLPKLAVPFCRPCC